MPGHDALYHRLFSHPEMVDQLMRDFVPEPWVARLDPEAMERVSAKFHADDDRRREADVIWRVPMLDGGGAYLLLLLEFQSTQDRWMALRVLVYVGLLWQQFVRERRLTADGKLPPVFALVIYNGDPRWVVPLDLNGLIGLADESPLWNWQPRARYLVLDEGRYAEADQAARDTVIALLFRVEHARDPNALVSLCKTAADWFKRHPGLEAVQPIIQSLFARVINVDKDGTSSVALPNDWEEFGTVLETRAAEWFERYKQEGRREGRREERASMLLRQMERRFGPLPDAATDRIGAAELDDLEEWSLRVLDARDLDDVFGATEASEPKAP